VRESVGRRQQKVVEICTKYAQKGMFNIFLASSSAPGVAA
jgi:hypothetical protein